MAMTDENTSGPKDSIASVPSTISATKSAPPMGALYALAMPPGRPARHQEAAAGKWAS